MRSRFDAKWIPNMITLIRIALCLLLFFVQPLSLAFNVIYISAILSDFLDGFLARRFNATSQMGSKLDSIADFILFLVIGIVIVSLSSFTKWVWYSLWGVFVLRIFSVLICYIKFHQFAILHTYMNKLVGVLCIAIPFTLKSSWFMVYAWFVIFVAALSVVEEIIIHLTSSKLNPDSKGLIASLRS